nr:MAG TPA: hypothetical protein [Caudoviricetes sp.]
MPLEAFLPVRLTTHLLCPLNPYTARTSFVSCHISYIFVNRILEFFK